MEIITAEELARRIGEAAGEMEADREIRGVRVLKAHNVITQELESSLEAMTDLLGECMQELAEANASHARCHDHLDRIIAACLYVAAGWMGKQYPDAPPDELFSSVMEEARIRAAGMVEEHGVYLFPQADVEGEGDSDIARRGGI